MKNKCVWWRLCKESNLYWRMTFVFVLQGQGSYAHTSSMLSCLWESCIEVLSFSPTGNQSGHPFLFLVRCLEALLTGHHSLRFFFTGHSIFSLRYTVKGRSRNWCKYNRVSVECNKDNTVPFARKYCPVRHFLIFPSILSSWLVLPNFLMLFPWLPQGSRVRCICDMEVRHWKDTASGLDSAWGLAQVGSCHSTAVGDSSSHPAFSQAPWVVWESSAVFFCWMGSGREEILLTVFLISICIS